MAGRFVQVSRSFSTNKALLESLKEPLKASAAEEVAHGGGSAMWKKIFFVVACPGMAVAYLNVALTEEEKPPEFKKYSHLRIRHKQYPWRDGVKTLFHNPHTNALPDGYETVGH